MIDHLWSALAGFGAQLVDGALGMGYGITGTSLLLTAGFAPAIASASINFAQLGTTLSSGLSHWRVGNVDWRIVRRLSLTGGLGALAGATVLSSLSTAAARPVMAVLLLLLGAGVILRFVTRRPGREPQGAAWAATRWFLAPLGLVGGFVNSTGGGGWGPVVTSTLLSTGPVPPRKVIGSVSTSEFVVTVCASIGFVLGLGLAGMQWGTILALMIGGVLAAPVAARLAGRLPSAILGVAVGSLIITLNLGPVLTTVGLGGQDTLLLRLAAAAGCLLLIGYAATRHVLHSRRVRAEQGEPGTSAAEQPQKQPAATP
ncbi:sulfite exporter TauE/SafE family protein [Ornithinimicrobium sp. Y1847]|uniref:sulfite exporter TauE/SafE family protein n=1 Tax=unclassified Ornithinimicrobium TaxID=2615080 RepID=UPI003B67C081